MKGYVKNMRIIQEKKTTRCSHCKLLIEYKKSDIENWVGKYITCPNCHERHYINFICRLI